MNETPKCAYVSYVGTNEPIEHIKNFEYIKHEPKIKYKVKWQDQFYYGTIAFLVLYNFFSIFSCGPFFMLLDSEESINEQAETNRPKFLPENLLVSNDESDECTSTDSLGTNNSTLLTTKLALLLEKQTEENNQDPSKDQKGRADGRIQEDRDKNRDSSRNDQKERTEEKNQDASSKDQKERADGRKRENREKHRDSSRKDQKEKNENDHWNTQNVIRDRRVEKITMIEQKLAELKRENRSLKVEVDMLKNKNKELQDSSNEFQKLNILLQRDAIKSIEDMRIQLSTLLNKPYTIPEADQLDFPEVGFVRASDNSIHIGRGVWLTNEIYDTIYCTSKTPSTFITNMAVAVFGTTCLKGSTGTGKISNRTINKSGKPARPALDTTKLLAIEDIFRFWLQKKNKNSVEINNQIFKMTSYISKKISQLNYVKKKDEFKNTQVCTGLSENSRSSSNGEDKYLFCSGQKVPASPSSTISNMSM